MSPIGTCTVDVTGLIVTSFAGRQFAQSWVGLPLLINGNMVTVASVQGPGQLTLATVTAPTVKPVYFQPIRETVYKALFNLLSTISTNYPNVVTTFSRTPQVYASVGAELMPYVFIEQRGENPKREGRGMPYNWEFDVAIGIYTFSADPDDIPPVTLLNPILDAVEATLNPSPPQQALTLDGLVYEVRLIGNGMEAAGAVANNAWAYVPARMYLT